MSASTSTDCYLCGARNDLVADYCVRCDGQLLKLPTENLDLESADPADLIDDDVSETEADDRPTRLRRNRSGSVEDQRLSDALGMSDDDIDPALMDTVVTSIPRVIQSVNIPLIGTRPGVVSQHSMHAKEFGRRTYFLLAMLLLATAWLGWVTLSGGDETPENLAFTNSTAPQRATTTTETPRRQWSEAEVVGRYGGAFTRVQLYVCPAPTAEAATKLEPLDDMWTSGIAVHENNVILNSTDLLSANVAVIRSRTGQQRLAIIGRSDDGSRIATTSTSISRHLGLQDTPGGEATYVLTYDLETNVVETAPESTLGDFELHVTDLGDVDSVRVGRVEVDTAQLLRINGRAEPIEIEDAPKPESICDRAWLLAYQPAIETTNDETEAN